MSLDAAKKLLPLRSALALGALAGALLWSAFPPLGQGWLAGIALLPLWYVSRHAAKASHAALGGLTGGLLFGLLSVHWLRIAHPLGYLGWVALAAYLSCYWSVAAVLAWCYRGTRPLEWATAAATVWVGLEYLRGWLLGGFPWFYLPHPLYRYPAAIQSVAVLSTYGLSWCLAWCSALLVGVCPRRTIAPRQAMGLAVLAAIVLAANLAYGLVVLRAASTEGSRVLRVALIQTNVPQEVKAEPAEAQRLEQHFLALARRVGSDPVELVIWPETTWRHVWVELDSSVSELVVLQELGVTGEQLELYRQRVRANLQRLARLGNAPMLLGLNIQRLTKQGVRTFNSALLLHPDGRWDGAYHKNVLLPFGEYVPLERWLPWLRWLSPNTQGSGSLSPGDALGVFEVAAVRFGVLICFEDTLPWLSRRYVREQEVELLVNLTNDGWFGRTAEHEVHLAISVFRAVECGRPLVRAVNTGISAIIDAYGRLLEVPGPSIEASVWREAILRGDVPLVQRQTPYVWFVGDSLGRGAELFVLVSLVLGPWRLRRTAGKRG